MTAANGLDSSSSRRFVHWRWRVHDLMAGKSRSSRKEHGAVFGASPEKLFLVDANRCATAEGLPGLRHVRRRGLQLLHRAFIGGAWDLSMLKVLNDDMRVKYDAYWSRVKRPALGALCRAQKRKEEEDCGEVGAVVDRWRHRQTRRGGRRTRRTCTLCRALRLGGVGVRRVLSARLSADRWGSREDQLGVGLDVLSSGNRVAER